MVLEVLKDTVPPEQLKQVVADLQALQKKDTKPGKEAVQECIVNVVGADAYKKAALKAKADIAKASTDPTKQGLNLERYEELMKQAKARYALDNTEKKVGPDTDEYEKAKQEALQHLEERAKKEAEAKGEFRFSGASTFSVDIGGTASSVSAGKGSASKSKSKGKAKGKAATSKSPSASPATAAISSDKVFSFKLNEPSDTNTTATATPFNFGTLNLNSDEGDKSSTATTSFSFGSPSASSDFSFGAKKEEDSSK